MIGWDDEFGTFYTGRSRDVHCGTVAAVVGACYFGNGIGFGMEHIGFGEIVFIFTYILKTGWRAVISVRDNHFILYDECTHLTTLAV